MLILIAGPYKSGTNGDPAAMAANLARLEQAAWPIFQAGHVPVIGEWLALPLLASVGATVNDPLAHEVLYPTADRLLHHCDAVLRLPGVPVGADQDVALARERGLSVFFDVDDIPQWTCGEPNGMMKRRGWPAARVPLWKAASER